MPASDDNAPILFFDGVCNLCNRLIQFVLDDEEAADLRFVSLQSPAARPLLERAFGADEAEQLVRGASGTGAPDSVVLVEGERGWTHSDAALRVSRHLRAPYRWLSIFAVVPRPLRDAVYRWIARNRYGWFGRSEACRIPTPDVRPRFLDAAPADGPPHARA